MSTNCGDVLALDDLKTARKHQLFEAEVITGRQGGVASGTPIDYATNQVTGQVQKTLPAILRDTGFKPASFDFSTGGTLGVNDRDKVVYDPVSKTWYSWGGALPHVIAAGTNPVGVADWTPQTDPNLRADLASTDVNKGASLIGAESGETVQEALNGFVNALAANTVKPKIGNLSGAPGVNTGDTVMVLSFHEGLNSGGGLFMWNASQSKSTHNGGTVVDPDVAFPATWDAAGKTAWFTATGSGSGVWVRVKFYDYLRAEFFGAISWNPGDTYDSTLEFQQTANVAGRGGVWRWSKRHRTTSYVLIPNKQTFGSFSQTTSVYSELFNPTNYQGIHVDVAPELINTITSAVFYDSDTGEAFRCGEGSVPSKFLLYGRGMTSAAYGTNISAKLPAESAYYVTSGLRHGKYIRPENVTIAMFKYPRDSNPWDPASKGDYYTRCNHCVEMYSFCMWRVGPSAAEPTFNTTHISPHAYVNKIVENAYATRDVKFFGGSIEGYNTPTVMRESSSMSFQGTYFETSDSANTVMFNVAGWTALSFEKCRIYMDYTTRWVTTGGAGQTAGVTGISVTGHGNVWRKADGGSSICFEYDGVVRKSTGLYGDILHLATGSTLGYYAGAVPSGIYQAPITLTGS